MDKNLFWIYTTLLDSFGPQGWWPAKTRFEVMIGAILTQNTNWKNVEKVIAELEKEGLLRPKTLDSVPLPRLAKLIRPAGYFNQKAKKLKAFMRYFEDYGFDEQRMMKKDKKALRKELLSVWGIGPETADSILLYALDKNSFVIDAYTRRVFSRMGLVSSDISYDDLKAFFEKSLIPDKTQDSRLKTFKEYHALIDELAKRYCRTSPLCENCPVLSLCKSKGKIIASKQKVISKS